jgi:hypothetical protein
MTARVIKFTTLNTTNLRQITAGKAVIVGAILVNTSVTVPYFVKFYDVIGDTAPTVGTTVPFLTIPCPCIPASGAGTDGMASPNIQIGVSVVGRLYVAVTAAAADTDTTAVAAGSIVQILIDGG